MAWVLNMATGVDRNIPGDDPKDALIKAVLLARKAFNDDSPAPERAEVEAGIKQANRVLFYGDYTVLVDPFKVELARKDGESDLSLAQREAHSLEVRATKQLDRILGGAVPSWGLKYVNPPYSVPSYRRGPGRPAKH